LGDFFSQKKSRYKFDETWVEQNFGRFLLYATGRFFEQKHPASLSAGRHEARTEATFIFKHIK
jgi:hypothetical protein